MGKKTSFTLKILAASLFTMLAVSFLFTDSIGLVSFGDEGGDVAVGDLADGTYTGTADGHNAPLTVEVTVEGGEITDVSVLSHEESDGIADPAIADIPTAIVDSNSTDVEVISGATITSDAIKSAVNNALSGEAGEPSEIVTEEEPTEAVVVSDNVYEDGTYEVTVEGHNGPLTVEVVVADGTIASVEVLEHEETDGLADPALTDVPAAIVASNSTEVDTISGATVTSDAVIQAVNEALGIEPVEVSDNVYEDGTYEVTVEGHNGPMKVEVVVEEGAIASVEVLEHEETDGLADPALTDVPAAIVASNSTEVDTISGATVTSAAIIQAVNEALGLDAGPKVQGLNFTDGIYEGTAEGRNAPITVEVTVTDGNIAEVVILEHEESEEISDPAIAEIPTAIVENNSTDVEVVSGASLTSTGIKEAVDVALLEAATAYQVTVEGHNGPITFEVVLEDGAIASVEATEHEETEGLGDVAMEDLAAAMVENNTADVEVVSGATVSSEAMIEAVNLILEVAN